MATNNHRSSSYLAGNGALLILVGLLVGLAIPAAPYPRLMLTAHIQFLVNGMISVFAGLLLMTSLSVVRGWSARLIVWGHVSLWAVCFSEVGAAVWGAKQTLPIAAAQGGAPGAESWQELLVQVCHVVPALLLIAAWILLVLGVYRNLRGRDANPAGLPLSSREPRRS
jgi:hydroxylaminobenzene mutase